MTCIPQRRSGPLEFSQKYRFVLRNPDLCARNLHHAARNLHHEMVSAPAAQSLPSTRAGGQDDGSNKLPQTTCQEHVFFEDYKSSTRPYRCHKEPIRERKTGDHVGPRDRWGPSMWKPRPFGTQAVWDPGCLGPGPFGWGHVVSICRHVGPVWADVGLAWAPCGSPHDPTRLG